MKRVCWVLFAVAVIQSVSVFGGIVEQNLENDPRQIISFGVFGFAEGGEYHLRVSKFSAEDARDGNDGKGESMAGFLAIRTDSRAGIDFKDITKECPFARLGAPPNERGLLLVHNKDRNAGGELTFTVGEEEDGFYATYFLNCRSKQVVSFSLELTEVNPGPSFLSIGEENLPAVFFVFCLVNGFLLAFWIWWLHRKRENMFRIHLVMTLLLSIKVLFLFFESVRYRKIRNDGKAPFLSVPYYLFKILESTVFFVVILLIGTGWSFMKPFLSAREKTILKVVVPLQIIADIGIIVAGELSEGSPSLRFWENVSRFVDIVCCCAVLFPIVWSIQHLKQSENIDGKQPITLRRLEAFRSFYIATVAFIYFTRIVVVLLRSVLGHRREWYADVMAETAAVLFYALVAYQFRPTSENPYLRLAQEDVPDSPWGDARDDDAVDLEPVD